MDPLHEQNKDCLSSLDLDLLNINSTNVEVNTPILPSLFSLPFANKVPQISQILFQQPWVILGWVGLGFSLVFTSYLLWRGSRMVIECAISYVRRLLMVSIQVTGELGGHGYHIHDQSYRSLIKWLGRNFKSSLHSQKTHPKTVTSNPNEDGDLDTDDEEGRPSKDFEYVYRNDPTVGYGVNNISYKGRWIQVRRDVHYGSQEIVELRTFIWNKSLLSEILEKANPKPRKKDNKTKTIVYRAVVDDDSCYWNRLGNPKKKRPLSTLILDDKVVNNVIEDIKKFEGKEDWYSVRGIPYRRGYLLYGPPGCGKSSIVKSIAGELNYDICVLSLSQRLTDDGLTQLFNSAPERSIILLEDIDAVFKSREDNDGDASCETNLAFAGGTLSSLTFMGLLNALDGVASSEFGQIVVMTTNYPQNLDPALVRPGRVDMKVLVDYPSDAQLEGMFKKFYPEKTEDKSMIKKFVKKIRSLDLSVSMAMLQSLMVVYPDDPEGAIDKAEAHFKDQFGNGRLAKDRCIGLYC